jgi:hypothetical protein
MMSHIIALGRPIARQGHWREMLQPKTADKLNLQAKIALRAISA